MKKYLLFLIILLTIGCKKDLYLSKLTIVEGTVTDYYSKNPVADIPLVITTGDDLDYTFKYKVLDTIITDQNGYYYYELLIDTVLFRYHRIETVETDFYASSGPKEIYKGRKNRIAISIIPIIH